MRIFLFVAFSLLFCSCFDQGDCLINSTNNVAFGLYKTSAHAAETTVKFEGVNIPGVATYNTDQAWGKFLLPLDPNADQTTFVFKYGGVSDTLVLGYTKQSKVLAPDCGSFLYFDNLTILHTTFAEDRVSITDPKLLTTVAPNIKLFY